MKYSVIEVLRLKFLKQQSKNTKPANKTFYKVTLSTSSNLVVTQTKEN